MFPQGQHTVTNTTVVQGDKLLPKVAADLVSINHVVHVLQPWKIIYSASNGLLCQGSIECCWAPAMDGRVRVPTRGPRRVITWRWNLSCNGNHWKSPEESYRCGIRLPQKGREYSEAELQQQVTQALGSPDDSVTSPRCGTWSCTICSRLSLLCPRFSLLEWNCSLYALVY